MRFTESTDVSRENDKADEGLKFTQKALENIQFILNNGITFTENFDAKFLTITFSAADTNVATFHGLGRVPTGYIVIGRSAAASIYNGSSANTSSLLYLRASAAATCRVMVF